MFVRRFMLAAVLVFLSATAVRAACGPFPNSVYLGTYTHAQIQKYVATKHNGDWSPYLSLLAENLKRLRTLNLSGDGAVLRVQGQPTRLSANELTRFIYTSRQWLDVAQCLSNESGSLQTALNVNDLNDFTTAAGGDTAVPRDSERDIAVDAPSKAAKAVADEPLATYLAAHEARRAQATEQVAHLSAQEIAVRIEAKCNGGYTSFRIANNGAAWPATGMFSMYRIDGPNKELISARRLSMDANEKKHLRSRRYKTAPARSVSRLSRPGTAAPLPWTPLQTAHKAAQLCAGGRWSISASKASNSGSETPIFCISSMVPAR